MTGLIRAKFFLGEVFVAKAKLLLVERNDPDPRSLQGAGY